MKFTNASHMGMIVSVFACTFQAAWAQDADALVARLAQLVEFKDVRSVALSPDGKSIACTVAAADLKANRIKTELWLLPTIDGPAARVALDIESVEKALWSPRGGKLAVIGTVRLADGGTETALCIVEADSKQSRRLTRIERGNHYLAPQGATLCWSPDGASLAFLAAEPAAKASIIEPLVVTRQQYKTRSAFSDNRPTHIWVVDVANGKTRQLTTGRFDEHSIDWSPMGDEIVFCSNRSADPDANLNYDLFIVNVADGSVGQFAKTAGSEMTPVWSPEGRFVAYTMTKRSLTTIDSVAEDDHVWLLERATGEARELTAKLDRRCSHVRWSADGGSVDFLARDKGRALIYRVAVAGGDATPLFEMDAMVGSFSLPGKDGGERGCCVLSTPTKPAEVWTFDREGKNLAMRSRFNVEAGERTKPTAPTMVSAKSFDGTPIQGWLLTPDKATPQAKVPVILAIHGGPHGMYGYAFSPTFQLLRANGYAVLYLNPRGSNGYGQSFSDGCVNDWGGADYKDLMAGLDHALAKHPELDAERLGVMGGSYGGYMTNWIITQTTRFKAAVSYAGLSNLISFYSTSLYQDLIHVEFGGEPWDRYEILWERSPLRHIKKAATPTLILHGEADFDVHISQSEELYTALKRRGVETVFVRYPREGHGPSEPRFQVDHLQRTAAWFDRYLRAGD